jgi:hypothetical protein
MATDSSLSRALGGSRAMFGADVEKAIRREIVVRKIAPRNGLPDSTAGLLFSNFPADDEIHDHSKTVADVYFDWQGLPPGKYETAKTHQELADKLQSLREANSKIEIFVVSHGVTVGSDDDAKIILPHGDGPQLNDNCIPARAIVDAAVKCGFGDVTMVLGACNVMPGEFKLCLAVLPRGCELITFGTEKNSGQFKDCISLEMIHAAICHWAKKGGTIPGNMFRSNDKSFNSGLNELYGNLHSPLGRGAGERAGALRDKGKSPTAKSPQDKKATKKSEGNGDQRGSLEPPQTRTTKR